MNQFEKRMNALRLQYKAERVQIQKDANRTIGRLNTAIGQTTIPEARQALREEKSSLREAMRQSMKINKDCYHAQLEQLTEEYAEHLKKNQSRNDLRRAVALLSREAEAAGEKQVTISFGNNRHCTVTFD